MGEWIGVAIALLSSSLGGTAAAVVKLHETALPSAVPSEARTDESSRAV